jgi:hypothetical protein
MVWNRMRVLAGVVSACVAWPSLGAQGATYARSARDTLRFREVTNARIVLETPQGGVVVTSEHDAIIAVAFGARDVAHAWYETLMLSSSSPQGTLTPQPGALIKAPFDLSFTARGVVRLIKAPEIPGPIAAITDLAHQFDDFFVRMPTGELRAGRQWTDTNAVGDSTSDHWYKARTIAHYTVRGDTLVNGEKATAIMMQQELSVTTGGPVPEQPVRTSQRLAGSDSGVVVFSVARGRLLGRARIGVLTGAINLIQGATTTTLPQRYSFDSTISAEP